MTRVLIADDHSLTRDGIRHVLEKTNQFEVVGEAIDGQSTLAMIRAVFARVLVLDLSMPGISGDELISQIRRENPGLRILILTVHDAQQYAVSSFKAGVSGYLTKRCASAELITALSKVASGGVYISLSVAESLALRLAHPVDPFPHQRLSSRELEVYRRLTAGETLRMIAEALFINVKTVSTYKARILEKMHLPHEVALIRYAVHHELFDQNE